MNILPLLAVFSNILTLVRECKRFCFQLHPYFVII